jgi:HTH-type transcriptional regulator, transcriptional repressor of NAD biosynthesis genes
LAQQYDTAFVHEVSRDVISTNDFSLEDIVTIGHAQTQAVQEAEKRANKILFCDTDVITTQIYSDYYLHEIPPVLFDLEKEIRYDVYFLLDIDVPWIADGLRDLGHKRQEMYEIFKNALEVRGIEYIKISGDFETRVAKIREVVKERFGL